MCGGGQETLVGGPQVGERVTRALPREVGAGFYPELWELPEGRRRGKFQALTEDRAVPRWPLGDRAEQLRGPGDPRWEGYRYLGPCGVWHLQVLLQPPGPT